MKKIVFVILISLMLFSNCFAFSDVTKEHWGYVAINDMQKQGIVSGFYDNTFRPDEKITKEQLAAIVTNAFNLTGSYSYNFTDVSVNRWSYDYIKTTWQYFSNLRQGNKYYFEPEKLLTREEAAKTMVKVLNIDYSSADLTVLEQFADRNNFSEPKFIALAVTNGIMNGKGGYFDSKSALTRAEVTAIMYNVLVNEESNMLNYSDFDLLTYMPQKENYMISPLSIKMAMMMAANGADGETQKEILNAFDVEDIGDYNNYSKEIIKKYNSNEKVKLNIANSIWLNTDNEVLAEFDSEFREIIEEYFDGIANKVNNTNAVELINNWCSEKTNEKINEIIDSSDFFAALVNALYFKGEWANQFKEYNTAKDNFTAFDNSKVEKDFMNQIGNFDYYEDDTMKMVELPYKDYNTSMYVILPKTKELDIENAINGMEIKKVHIKLPKFKVEFSETLNEMLKKMGIEKAFSAEFAEFNDKMFDNVLENVYIDRVLHKTFIEVDENGTEAAAVTADIMILSAAIKPVEEVKEFIADRPFIFFIRDNESGAVLFMGEIVK